MAKKGKLVPTLLCFFLGPIGIHDFYAGKTVLGLVHIVLLIVTAWCFFFAPLINSSLVGIGFFALIINGIFVVIEFLALLISDKYGDCEGW